jgi:hypothetical protein
VSSGVRRAESRTRDRDVLNHEHPGGGALLTPSSSPSGPGSCWDAASTSPPARQPHRGTLMLSFQPTPAPPGSSSLPCRSDSRRRRALRGLDRGMPVPKTSSLVQRGCFGSRLRLKARRSRWWLPKDLGGRFGLFSTQPPHVPTPAPLGGSTRSRSRRRPRRLPRRAVRGAYEHDGGG